MPMEVSEPHRIRKLIRSAKTTGISPVGLPVPRPEDFPEEAQKMDGLLAGILAQYELSRHNEVTKDDVEVSDMEQFDLAPGETRTITMNVDTGYVLLIKKIFVPFYFNNSYSLKFNGNTYIDSPELEIDPGFLAVNENTQITFEITNNSEHSYGYVFQITAWYRTVDKWEWSTVSYKSELIS